MSQFVKSSVELSALRSCGQTTRTSEKVRVSGFTEAELAAAEWSRNLVEVQENLSRPTNIDARQPTQKNGIESVSRTGLAGSHLRYTTKSAKGEHSGQLAHHGHSKEKRIDDGGKKEKKSKGRDGEPKKLKKDAKPKKLKKDKEEAKESKKDAKKMAKRLRKEEKQRKKQDKQERRAKAADVKDHWKLDNAKVCVASAGVEDSATAFGICSAIDQLIDGARVKASSAEHGPTEESCPAPDVQERLLSSSGGSSSSTAPALMQTLKAESIAALGLPSEPLNPLGQAHDLQAYAAINRRKDNAIREEPEWDHLPFLRRSPSPCRERTKGTMWPTRRGAWKSRAGGVYLPPTDGALRGKQVEGRERATSKSPSDSPARYIYPEEFQKRARPCRRSPSYNPEPKSGSDSTGSSKSRSSSTSSYARFAKKARKRPHARSSSSSQSKRASPVYELDAASDKEL